MFEKVWDPAFHKCVELGQSCPHKDLIEKEKQEARIELRTGPTAWWKTRERRPEMACREQCILGIIISFKIDSGLWRACGRKVYFDYTGVELPHIIFSTFSKAWVHAIKQL